MAKALNPKQQRFVELFLATGNATQSYARAGYKAKGRSAGTNASRLLTNETVQAALAAATQSGAEATGTSVAWTLAHLRVLALYDGPRSSHLARVQACKALLDFLKEPPPPPATNVNVNVTTNTTLADRIDQYETAFAAAADREGTTG